MNPRPLLALALCAGFFGAPGAQQLEPAYPDQYPPPLPDREGPSPPKLVFSLLDEIVVPGPLGSAQPALEGGRLWVLVPGGHIGLEPRPGAVPEQVPARTPELEDPPDHPPLRFPSPWIASEDRALRFRTIPEGRVVAQRLCPTCPSGWRTAWVLRVGGAVPAPPLPAGDRLFFASLDNQVYAVRAGNGHRLWAVDVGERISRPLALWRGEVPFPTEGGIATVKQLELVLVVPDGGNVLLALDPYDGARLAEFVVREGSGIATAPLVTPDGYVAVGRQGYLATDASVLLLDLALPPPAEAAEPTAAGPAGAGATAGASGSPVH